MNTRRGDDVAARRRTRVAAIAVVIVLLLAACGGSDDAGTPSTTDGATTTSEPAGPDLGEQLSHWTDTGPTNLGFHLRGAAVFHDRLVVVKNDAGVIAATTTTDGMTWTPAVIEEPTPEDMSTVVLVPMTDLLVLVTPQGPTWTSTDGITFAKAAPLPRRPEGDPFTRVGLSDGSPRGDGGVMAGEGEWYTASSSVFVSHGIEGFSLSADGTAHEWPLGAVLSLDATEHADPSGGLAITTTASRIVILTGLDVSADHTGPTQPAAFASDDDGQTWTQSAAGAIGDGGPPEADARIEDAAATAKVVVASGVVQTSRGGRFSVAQPPLALQRAVVWTSADEGATWTPTTLAGGKYAAAGAMTAGPDGFVVSGRSADAAPDPTRVKPSGEVVLWTSSDGTTWSTPVTAEGIEGTVELLAPLGDGYVAVGADDVGQIKVWRTA